MEKEVNDLNKSVNSIIEEIKAQDIYTLFPSSTNAQSLPCISLLNSSYDSLVDKDSVWKKSSLKCRSVFRKLSIQEMKRSLLNLPALIEEDQSYFPSLPVCSLDLSHYNNSSTPHTVGSMDSSDSKQVSLEDVKMCTTPTDDDGE